MLFNNHAREILYLAYPPRASLALAGPSGPASLFGYGGRVCPRPYKHPYTKRSVKNVAMSALGCGLNRSMQHKR